MPTWRLYTHGAWKYVYILKYANMPFIYLYSACITPTGHFEKWDYVQMKCAYIKV